MIALPAYAKINLTLEVLGKRPDGYHEIRSVLQTIDLADRLTFEANPEIRLVCSDPGLVSEDNLVLRAARLLSAETHCDKGALLYLEKRVPEAGGLGGGSSDAATTLVGLNQLWNLNLSRQRLASLGSRLGSDVPFLIYGGTARAEGRGEKITPLRPLPETWLVLLKPPLEPTPGKTARLYAQLIPAHYTTGDLTQRLADAVDRGKSLDASLLYNVFERVAFDFFPGLSEYRQRLIASGAASVHLAGSGPILFSLVGGEEEGQALCHRLGEQGLEAYLACTV